MNPEEPVTVDEVILNGLSIYFVIEVADTLAHSEKAMEKLRNRMLTRLHKVMARACHNVRAIVEISLAHLCDYTSLPL